MILAISLAVAVWIVTGVRLPARRHSTVGDDEATFTELVAMALTAGHGFPGAVSLAADAGGGDVADRAIRALRRDTPDAPAVFAVARHARLTGAPIGESIAALAHRQRAEQLEAIQASIRKLPVRLVVPLALLILPGTVLLALTPVVLGAIERFAI
ncbi:MAG: hypothetical protein KJP12_05075 [Acidimicrobiia bacterium]|nr:hypothetical protein [Acidimicrobiia bacterium]NNK91239.1 hypothetical protein [Acidimicrobiia bacterium]